MDDLWVDDASMKLGCRDDERLFVMLFARSIMIWILEEKTKTSGTWHSYRQDALSVHDCLTFASGLESDFPWMESRRSKALIPTPNASLVPIDRHCVGCTN